MHRPVIMSLSRFPKIPCLKQQVLTMEWILLTQIQKYTIRYLMQNRLLTEHGPVVRLLFLIFQAMHSDRRAGPQMKQVCRHFPECSGMMRLLPERSSMHFRGGLWVTQRAHVWPARHDRDNKYRICSVRPRFRLKASVDIRVYSPAAGHPQSPQKIWHDGCYPDRTEEYLGFIGCSRQQVGL